MPIGGLVTAADPPGHVFARCAAATTVAAACEGLVDDLYDHWPLPSVYLLVDGRLRCQAARGYFRVVDGFPPGTGIIGRAVESGQPLLVNDVSADPGFIPALPGLVAKISAPVTVGGTVVGAVNVESHEPLDQAAADALVHAAATLADRIEAVGGLPPVPLAQRLARIAIGLSSLTDVAQIQGRTVAGARQISGMSTAALSLVDADDRWSVHADGPLHAQLEGWTDNDHRDVAAWVAAGTSSHFPGGTEAPDSYAALLGTDIRSLLVQPLVAGGRVMGLLTTADAQPVPHDSTVGAAIELLASQAAAALGMAEALAELSRRATQDPLTGLCNSAAFSADLLAAERHVAERRRTVTACLLLDVDHFKQVNDTYGHLAGDRLLVGLAGELRRELRDGDDLYRIGGDEFAVLIRDINPGAAHAVAERLVEAARRVRSTVSVGAAVLDDAAEDVRVRADRALYRAKRAGRDRAAMATDDDG
jgi:diguanylate cyclase (GGDEF)-like protein